MTTLLDALLRNESGGRNIANTDAGTDSGQAQGYFQITTGTWNDFGGQKYAVDPLHASYQQQAEIASKIPLKRWDESTVGLMRATGRRVDPNLTLGENLAANGESLGSTLSRRVSGPVEAAGGGAGADVGATPLYNPGPVLDATAFSRPKSDDSPIELVPSRERTMADDFADAYDGSSSGRRSRGDSGGLIYSPLDQNQAPLPEFDFASANAEPEGQVQPAAPTMPQAPQPLADLFKVGDIGMAGKLDPVTGLPVLPQGRRAYG